MTQMKESTESVQTVFNRPSFWRVLVKDLRGMLAGWGGVVAIAALIGMEGALFWLFARFNLGLYLFVSYVILPTFLLLHVSGIISSERQGRFTEILFTTPLSWGRYLSLRFMMGAATAVLFFVLKLPFVGLLLYFAGTGWLSSLPEFWVLYPFYALFLVCFGLLISVGVGSRGLRIASFLSISLIVLYLFSPFAASPQVGGGIPSELQETYFKLLHFSPVFGAYSFLDINEWVTPTQSLPSLAVLAALSIAYVSLAAVTFRWLQIPTGWRSGSISKLLILLLLVAGSTLVPLALAPDYELRSGSWSSWYVEISPTSGLFISLRLEGDESLLVHGTYPATLRLSFDNSADEPVTFHDIRVFPLEGDVLFNATEIRVGDVSVPACVDCREFLAESKAVELPLTLQILKTSALSAERVEFSGMLVNYAEYGFEVLGEEFSVVMRHELWGIEPAGYRQEYPFIVAFAMIVGVLFRPLKRRWARS